LWFAFDSEIKLPKKLTRLVWTKQTSAPHPDNSNFNQSIEQSTKQQQQQQQQQGQQQHRSIM
jgi:hypothetical protein